MSYASDLKNHLSMYKLKRLGVFDDGIYLKDCRAYKHILPQSLFRLNVLETIRKEFWDHVQEPPLMKSRHRDFHHLNSSQAMAFNLFFPFFGDYGDHSAILLKAFDLEGRIVKEWCFEAVPEPNEKTNVDVLASFEGGARLFVEVKLSEAGFGSCQADQRHREKFLRTYHPLLQDKVNRDRFGEEIFFKHYQFFRYVSLLNLDAGDVLVVLLPEANKVLWNVADELRSTMLSEDAKKAVRVVALGSVIQGMVNDTCLPTILQTHFALLAEKYLYPP